MGLLDQGIVSLRRKSLAAEAGLQDELLPACLKLAHAFEVELLLLPGLPQQVLDHVVALLPQLLIAFKPLGPEQPLSPLKP